MASNVKSFNLGQGNGDFHGSGELVTRIRIHAGEILDGIQLACGGTWLPLCGGSGGSPKDVILKPGEHVVYVEARHGFVSTYYGGDAVSGLTFITSHGTQYGPYGVENKTTQKMFPFRVPDGMALVGVTTAGSKFLNGVSFHFAELTLYNPKSHQITLVKVTPSDKKDFEKAERKEKLGQPGVYPMFGARKGLACIIAVIDKRAPLLGYRTDALKLSQLWDQIGFDVYTPNVESEEITADKIKSAVKNFATMFNKSDQMAVLCIMAHGGDGFVNGADGRKVYITELTQYLDNVNCEFMAGKPKLILVQACQGGKNDKGIQRSLAAVPSFLFPTGSDMITCYPAMPGYVSWVYPDTGSVLVNIFTDVFANGCHNKELYDLMLEINAGLFNTIVTHQSTESKQMSNWHNSMRKKLYFLPCPGGKHGKNWK